MVEKKQWIETTRASIILAVYYGITNLIEEASSDLEIPPQNVEVDEKLLDIEWIESRLSSGIVSIRAKIPDSIRFGDLEDTIELSGEKPVTIKIIPDRELWGIRLGSLYELVPHFTLRTDSLLYKRLAFETTQNGIEYMGIYTEKGLLALFEGEYYKVTLPFVSSIASVHTHPEGSCMLSLKDVESGLDLLVEGGFFIAATTTSCAFAMYRYGLILEDDFFRIKETLLKARNNKPIESLRLESIRFYSMAY